MGNILKLESLIEKTNAETKGDKVDYAASYQLIKDCLAFLEFNQMSELKELKKEMRATLKDLEKNVKRY